MKKKGNKKMPIPRQEIIDNPIPTSLFMCYIYSGAICQNTCKCVQVIVMKNKDIGMELSMISCLGIGIFFLFPIFFMM